MNQNENAPARKYKRYDETFQRLTVEHWMLSGKHRQFWSFVATWALPPR